MKNKSYCAVAFNQIYSDSGARYRLCCHARPIDLPSSLDVLPFDHFHSEQMDQIRQDMVEGKPIGGCDKCYAMEDRGFDSYRTKYNNLYDLKIEPDKLHLKLRMFGSFCNLGCYMCYPYNSSKRREELTKKNIMWEDWDVKVKNISIKRFRETLDHINEHIDQVASIHITGGEPLQMPNTWALLRDIPKGYSEVIDIYIDTNLTELGEIKKYARRFNHVDLGVSCDHFGEQLKWIRYPINLTMFENNLKEAHEQRLVSSINVTVSLLNIDKLFEIQDYYHEHKVNFNVVSNPDMLSVKNIPLREKEMWIERYKDIPIVVQELRKEGDLPTLMKGIEYCHKLNKGRNADMNKLFPQLAEWSLMNSSTPSIPLV